MKQKTSKIPCCHTDGSCPDHAGDYIFPSYPVRIQPSPIAGKIGHKRYGMLPEPIIIYHSVKTNNNASLIKKSEKQSCPCVPVPFHQEGRI